MEKFMNGPFNRDLLIKEVCAPGNTFLMAVDGEEMTGYARLRENNSPPELAGIKTLEIARLYAASERIGKGIGKLLMQQSVDIARQKKISIIWLGVWEQNQRAIDFYTRWGFEKFGTQLFMVGDDAQTDWLMKKTI
jgi:ribosomal protein S18 acetylase RimI-like enzyme